MLTTLLRRSLQVHIALISLVYFPCFVLAIEPIGTIGLPLPEQHAFLSNEAIVRVVPTHIQIIDRDTGAIIDEFGERTDFSDVVFSPTASHLAILNHSGDPSTTTIKIWNVNAREQLMEWKFKSHVRFAAFSPTDSVFVTYSKGEVHLWNWQTGELIGTMTRVDALPIRAIVFSADGHHLMIVSARPDVELWNVETRRLDGHFEIHIDSRVEDVVISPDGKMIGLYERNSTSVHVCDVTTRRLLWQNTSGTGRISGMVFSRDSQRLYVASQTSQLSRSGSNPWVGWDDQVRVWDVKSGQQIDIFGTKFHGLETISLSPDGQTLLLHYPDAVVLWDLETNQLLDVWADFLSRFSNVKLSPDGKTVVSVSSSFPSGFIKTWDVSSQQMQLFFSAEKELLRGFAISPNSQKLAVVQDPWVQVRNLQTGRVETQFPHRVGYSQKITFSPSGRWIAVEEDWRDLFILDLESPKKLQRIKPEQINIYSQLAFSKDDEYLVAAGRGKDDLYWISLWKRERDSFVFQYKWQVPALYYGQHSALTFASNTVLAVPVRGTIQIWKLLPNGPKLLKTLDGDAPVHVSSDTRYLFANRNGNLRIWDWREETPMDYPSVPEYFALSRDGSVLLSETNTGQIQIWDGNALLPSQYCPIVPHGKQLVILGDVKRNQLLQNFPNPFNPETWIPFRLADESDVTIQIYNPMGQLVRRLSSGIMPAGDYSSQSKAIYWDGRNQTGEPVSSGVYLYTINAGDFSATRKMLIQK